jgi:Tol biopolymer transport system component
MKLGTTIVLVLALASAALGVACRGDAGPEPLGPGGSVGPDTTIALVARSSDRPWPRVYLVDADSGAAQELTDTDENEWWPTWSHDRQRLGFITWPVATPTPAATTTPPPTTPTTSSTPTTTPTTPAAPTTEEITQRRLIVANADGSDPHTIAHSIPLQNYSGGFSWSPDGEQIVSMIVRDPAEQPARSELRVLITADGSEAPLTDERLGFLPDWSPDGTKIVFGAFVGDLDERGKGESELFMMDSDGSNLRQITDRPGTDVSPAWSPDTTRIAWGGQTTESDLSARTNLLFMMDIASGRVTELGEGSDPLWSPDGQRVTYVVQEKPPPGVVQSQPNVDIYTLNVATGERTQLTQDPAQDLWPTWSPDGQRIAFVSKRDSPLGEIYVMNADGSDVRRLTNNNHYELMLAWAPR